MTTSIGLEHEARSHPLENKLQILRIACTDSSFFGLESRQTSSQCQTSGDAGQTQIHVEVLRRLATYYSLHSSPCTVSALTARQHQEERFLSGVVDTRHKPAAKTILVADTSATSMLPQPLWSLQ
jgi:hypothetical protein